MFNKCNRCMPRPMMGCGCSEPIVEAPICNCVERDFHQEVQQGCFFMIDQFVEERLLTNKQFFL